VTTIEHRRIANIRVGDRTRADPGDLGPLIDSIATSGLLHPVLIAPGGDLISGYRRLLAIEKMGAADVPVRAVATFEQSAPFLRAERLDPQCAVPMTADELISLVDAAASLRTVPVGECRDHFMDAFGMCWETAQRVRQVLAAARTGRDRRATEALVLIDRILAGESIRVRGRNGRLHDLGIAGAWRGWTIGNRAVPAKAEPPAAPVARRPPKPSQAASLASAVASLSGLTNGLSTVTQISPDVDPGDAAAWAQAVARATRVLRKLNLILKEYSSVDAR
jgi:hypothetical protein